MTRTMKHPPSHEPIILTLQRIGHFLIAALGAWYGTWAIVDGTARLYEYWTSAPLSCSNGNNLCGLGIWIGQLQMIFLLCLLPIAWAWRGRALTLVQILIAAPVFAFTNWLIVFGFGETAGRGVSNGWFVPAVALMFLLVFLALALWQKFCFWLEQHPNRNKH